MKKFKTRVLLTAFLFLSLFCFIYLNTREDSLDYNYTIEHISFNKDVSEFDKEDKSSFHIIKSGIILLAKAIVLSDK